MNISKRKQGILAIICTIAMIVTSITVYNPREVKADADYSKLTYNYKNDYKKNGEAYMKGSETTKSPWKVAIDESQSKGDIVEWMTTGAGNLNFYNEMFMNVTWHGNYPDATLEINGVKVEKEGKGVQVFNSVEIHVNAKEWINNNAYNVVKVTSKDGSQYVTFIVATGDKAVTSSEETTTAAYKDGEVLVNESNQTIEVPSYTGGNYWQKEYNNAPVKYVKGKKYVAEVVVSSTAAKKIKMVFQRGEIWDSVDANQGYEVSIAAGNKVKITYVFEATQGTDNGNFDIHLGSVADATTLVFESKKLTTYNEVPAGVQTGVEDLEAPGTTQYTVSIDGVSQACKEGTTIAVPADGQGYYDVTKKVAYAPGTVLTVNENMTLKSIKLNVTMTAGASIRLAAPTGLRFQTTVTSGNEIAVDDILDLKTGTVTTGTLITTLDLYKTHENKLTKDSDYTFLDIANDGWFNDGTKTETRKFCGSIIKIQSGNYDREFIAVGYATINYSNGKPKTVYANVTENNAKSIQYVAKMVKASDKFSGYSSEQKAIIDKYIINGKEISE